MIPAPFAFSSFVSTIPQISQPQPYPGQQKKQGTDQDNGSPGRGVQVEGEQDAGKAEEGGGAYGDPEQAS
jgi:hypothetical protein